jgi:hypothetical protein
MKNFQSVTFSLDFIHWMGDDFSWGKHTPNPIKEWANHFSLHHWECVLNQEASNQDDAAWLVTFKHIPKSSVTIMLISGVKLKLVNSVEYAIHPEAAKLFDFGD